MNHRTRIAVFILCFVSMLSCMEQAAAQFGRGVASAFKTTGGKGLSHMGPSVAFDRGKLNVAFAVVRRPGQSYEYLYLLIYKDPDDHDKSVGIEGTDGRSNDRLVRATHQLRAGGQQLDIAYQIELDEAKKKVATESLMIGKIDVDPEKGRIFLADFSVKPFTLRQVAVPPQGFEPIFRHRRWLNNSIPVAHPRTSDESIANAVFDAVATLSDRSLAVRSFLAAELAAEPFAHSSGDPRNLSLAEVRSVWDKIIDVDVPKDKEKEGGIREPFTWKTPAEDLRSSFRTNYGSLETYMAIRQAEIASELGLRAWSVDYRGGPILVWWEVEKEGDVVVPFELLGEVAGIYGRCDIADGRLIFWYLPGVQKPIPSDKNRKLTPRGRRIMNVMRTRDRYSDDIAHRYCLYMMGGPSIDYTRQIPGPSVGPWLWSEWNDAEFKRHSEPGPFHVTEECTLLDVEATEQDPSKGAQPRRVRLKLKAKPAERQ